MKILIAEDDPVSARLLQALLAKWGYDVVVARDGAEALGLLESDRGFDLAILDWMMPGMDGVQVCRRIRQHRSEPYVYLLLLTARIGKQDLLAGLEAGADDYLTKPFDPAELRARLRTAQRILHMQEELVSAREALREQARCDFLTGALNRAGIVEVLQREFIRGRRERRPLGVILADLDYFKRINDTCGHFTGDQVLREVARCMRSNVRSYDTLGRFGGEEFLLIVPGCDLAQTEKRAERLRASVAGLAVETPDGPIALTVSLGVAATSQAPEADADALLCAADAALYRAKEAGRNRVALATLDEISRFLARACPGTSELEEKGSNLGAAVAGGAESRKDDATCERPTTTAPGL